MIFTREQEQDTYRKLPQEVQDFIMSNDITDFISEKFFQAGLSEEQSALADTQILYAMIGLQSLGEAIKAIAQNAQKPEDTFSRMKSDLTNNIFNKIPKVKPAQNTEPTLKSPMIPEPILPEVIDAKETLIKTIENPPKAEERKSEMPAESLAPKKIINELDRTNSPSSLSPNVSHASSPVPVQPVAQAKTNAQALPEVHTNMVDEKLNQVVTSYPGGKDPYREPI